ncbi:MAG: four helix bundle protein [Thermodesulfobacteriota bacterium]
MGRIIGEAVRSRSDAEFVSKLQGGMQELEETIYWFELLVEAEIVAESQMADLIQGADEPMATLTTIVKNTKRKKRK